MSKITKVPNGPLIKKKGPFKGSTLKNGGTTTKQTTELPTLDTLYTKKNRIGNVLTNDYVGRMPSGAIEIGKVTKTSKDGKTTTTKKANQSGILGIKYTDDEIRKSMNEKKNGGMIKRADGSFSKRGLWDNIRANKGSGKKPTKQMLVQEKKIKAKSKK